VHTLTKLLVSWSHKVLRLWLSLMTELCDAKGPIHHLSTILENSRFTTTTLLGWTNVSQCVPAGFA
jgi:hypothetical protein